MSKTDFSIADVTGSLAAYVKLVEIGKVRLDFISGVQWLSVILDGYPTAFDNIPFIQVNGVQYFHDGNDFFALKDTQSDEVISLKALPEVEVDELFNFIYKLAEFMEEKTGSMISRISGNLL